MANAFARRLRADPTAAERHLWRHLRRRQLGGLRFRRQAPVGPFIADFVCFERRLVVECDGGQHADARRDEERDRWFARQGFLVLRFWNSDVLGNLEPVLQRILDAALERLPPP